MKIDENQLKEYGIFDLGENIKNTALDKNFNGDVWLNIVLKDKEPLNTQIANVTFAKKSRSNWHYHSSWQVLIGVAGVGLYCEENKEPKIIKKGMVINIPPETKHWHGAINDSCFTQLVLTPGETFWMKPVSDEEYNSKKERNLWEK